MVFSQTSRTGRNLSKKVLSIDKVRASRAGHTFHERWTARRALQLLFPKDDLYAIAVEGLSTSETAKLGKEAEEIADLTLFFGQGDNFATCEAQQTLQFKYKTTSKAVTSSYLKKTILKFTATLLGYEKEFTTGEIERKLSFSFVTNAEFSNHLWEAIKCLKEDTQPKKRSAQEQYKILKEWCLDNGVEAKRLFVLTEFRTSTQDLAAQNRELQQILSSWSPGADSQARIRLLELVELIRKKAGLSGQSNNLVKREDVLAVLGCDSEDDLFPADTKFVDVDVVIKRKALYEVRKIIEVSIKPVFVFADGGVGKTVFIQSLAKQMSDSHESVIFDCFGGGSYRSEDQSRHLPKIGLLQIVNELASRCLCDLQLPSDGDQYAQIKAARKRLEQAVESLRTQSAKKGVLVIIDAADNAQLEADDRKEIAFPRLLLASLSREPIDGVKLVLTARSHRMNSIINKSEVERFELDTFTEDETREFLKSRRNHLSQLEFSTALARSGGNARVLEYLVESWNENVTETTSKAKIIVENLIRQRCEKINRDLHQTGWNGEEVNEFFTAISLLPPPIPLKEMASALGWSESKVNSAVSDLAPMLEVVKHGAIFRDEPTETFIRESYASETRAQQEIADRLYAGQSSSSYAAEALPRFLVIINDSDRAYALSTSLDFPGSIQSEYGRRRLKLLRLRAAFSLAVRERDYDRMLKLTMQLAQVTSANAKGDQFIRRSPGVAVILGGQEASHRLFQDRSGWCGEKYARLTLAYAFLGALEEAEIYLHRTIEWINWHYRNHSHEEQIDRSGPSTSDFAAVVFLYILQGAYASADRNLANWDFKYALSVCQLVIAFIEQYKTLTGIDLFDDLVEFASSKNCQSLALQISLLASKRSLDFEDLKRVARAVNTATKTIGSDVFDSSYDHEQTQQCALSNASLAALLHNSRQSAANIIGAIKVERIFSSEYSKHHGPFWSWAPLLSACVAAWSAGQELRFHHFLPRDVELKRPLKLITDCSKLILYLESLKKDNSKKRGKVKKQGKTQRQFNRSECEDITKGIELIIFLARPLQEAILARRKIGINEFHKFIDIWESNLQLDIQWQTKSARNRLSRNVGVGFAKVFLQHASSISEGDASKLIGILSRGHFTINDRLDVLFLLAKHSNLHSLTGQFAQKLSQDIRQEEYISQRSEQYSRLAEVLLPMSTAESQEYFRQGLSQLDQMGADDYDIIYSLLQYAAEQHGGWLKLALGHRLMNLCQTIFNYEPSKFGWKLFGSAAAQSIGIQAIYKLVRWADQNVADLSYGLPQLACFLAKKWHLDPRRAAFMLLLCKDEGWHEWSIGDGLRDIFAVAKNEDRRIIWRTVFEKLKFEYPFGGPEYLWASLLESLKEFQEIADESEIKNLKILRSKARVHEEEKDRHRNVHHDYGSVVGKLDKENVDCKIEEIFEHVIKICNLSSPRTIDEAIRIVREDRRFMCNPGKKILERLRQDCPYNRQADFLYMLGELVELDFNDTIQILQETVNLWAKSSASISSNKKTFIQKVFEFKGSKLFELRYSGFLQEIRRLVDFCGDANFVLNLVFDTVAKEKVELTGDEWLQLASSLCQHTSGEANIKALEDLLSGPAAQISDEIGEGCYRESLAPSDDQSNIIAEITWHLLGNEDTFVRWTAARSIKGLVDLGLHTDVAKLLGCYDCARIDALTTEGTNTSFLNAQQWLLMGLARACLHHGAAMAYLKDQLEKLVSRNDIHAVNKVHIIRCLQHISGTATVSPATLKLWDEVHSPVKGYTEYSGRPKHVESKSGFHFDYDFNKYKISSFASLFGMSDAEAVDAIADEIRTRWPKANDMSFFSDQEQYRHSYTARYESYRESVQKHMMLSAATKLMKTRPIIRDNYEPIDARPWVEWLQEYDVSFSDGAWLSDRKDAVPNQAKQLFISNNKNGDFLESKEEMLKKVGLMNDSIVEFLPIHGSWQSGDGVTVRINSALIQRKGAISRCKAFSKQPYYNIWLPTFGSDGNMGRHLGESEFEPLIWLPDRYPTGIDSRDEFATRDSIIRPRLGSTLIDQLGLEPDMENREWYTKDGNLALRSQVWGQWRSARENYESWSPDEGMILWARQKWLDTALSKLNRSLVFLIDFYKYKSYKNYEDLQKLRTVYIVLRMSDGSMRIWKAKNA